MRLVVFVLAALIAGGPAIAQISPPWKEHAEVTEGFLLVFPGDPDVAYPKWELVPGRAAEASVYSVQYNNALFRMTVVDAKDTFLKEDPIVAQAIKKISEGGKLSHNEPT